jgi:hypothetical protein
VKISNEGCRSMVACPNPSGISSIPSDRPRCSDRPCTRSDRATLPGFFRSDRR